MLICIFYDKHTTLKSYSKGILFVKSQIPSNIFHAVIEEMLSILRNPRCYLINSPEITVLHLKMSI